MQIHSSAKRGDIETVLHLLGRGVPVDLRDPRGKHTPLMVAAASKRAGVEMLQLLISRGASLDALNGEVETTLLSLAAKSGDIAKTSYLLDMGANPRLRTPAGYTCLINAIHSFTPNIEIVKILIDAGVKINAVTRFGEFALGVAVYFANFELARLLLDAGADPAPLHWTALMHAIVFGTVEDVASEVQKGVDLDAKDRAGRTAWLLSLEVGDIQKSQILLEHAPLGDSADLFSAVRRDNPDMVAWLIDLGADINARDNFEYSVLMQAAERGCTECVRILLEKGADVQAANHVSHVALSRAANPEIARMLVQAGADINYVDGEGYTIMKHAAEHGDEALVRALLEMGASTEAGEFSGTPLYVAVREDELEIAKLLLNVGADPNAQTAADRWFPLQNAQSVEMVQALVDAEVNLDLTDEGGNDALQEQNDPVIAEFLIKAGAKVNPASGAFSVTPLIRAVEKNSLEMVRLFLDTGADVNAATSWGKTALMEACENSFVEGVRVLIQSNASVHLADEDGRTAVFYAAAPEGFTAYELMQKYAPKQNDKRQKKLAALGIQFDYTTTYGYVASDSIETLELLVQAGADINARANKTIIPLMFAASCGRPARVKGLLALGADKKLQDKDGRTALQHAQAHAREDHREEIIRLLTN